MKNKSLLSIEKNIINEKKRLIAIISIYHFLKSNDLEKSFNGEQIKAKYQMF